MKLMRSILLASAGLCSLTVACGDGSGSAGGAGVPPAMGGSASAAAGQAGVGGTLASTAGAGQGAASGSGGVGASGGAIGFAGSSADAGMANGGAGLAGTGGMPSSGLDPAQPPGKNFDLSHFALQLPVANGTGVQQISDLATYTSQCFYTGADGAMVFWCPVTGAHTQNTHYPRTELRELAPGGDWAISGTHTLTATFKVTQTPPSKGTIIGQIHGNATDGTAEILKLEWMTTNAIVASVEDDNNPATQINKTVGNYALGDEITYVIKLENSALTVTVTDANGSKSITSPYTALSWTKDKYYFKLGDYVQLNTGTDADGGRVSFYSFSVKHG